MTGRAKWVAAALAAVLVLSAAAMLIIKYAGSDGTVAEVYKNGDLVYSVDLSTVTESYTFTVGDDQDGWNTISVEPGRIRVSDASCHNHNCIETGWIGSGIKPIVCLPNKLVIKISGDADSGVDAISG